MRKILLLVCAIIFLASLLSGCHLSCTPAIINVECDELTQQKHISRQIDVCPSYTVRVYLCSNPSTGFSWSESAVISDQSVVQQTYYEFIAPEEPSLGTPGQEMWQFRALEKGTSTIKMEYSRPGEDGEKPEWTFTLTVTVKY
jgi:inhibitor of cysteine peptidase